MVESLRTAANELVYATALLRSGSTKHYHHLASFTNRFYVRIWLQVCVLLFFAVLHFRANLLKKVPLKTIASVSPTTSEDGASIVVPAILGSQKWPVILWPSICSKEPLVVQSFVFRRLLQALRVQWQHQYHRSRGVWSSYRSVQKVSLWYFRRRLRALRRWIFRRCYFAQELPRYPKNAWNPLRPLSKWYPISVCECNSKGTDLCDHFTGECSCFPGVEGRNCDICMADHWGYDSGEPVSIYLLMI